MQKLADLTTATTNARIKRMTLESQYQEIRNFKKKELSTAPQVSTDPVIQQLKIDLLNLEREYLELLKKFREKHPNVTALKSQITGLRNQTEAEIKRIVASLKKNYEMALAQERTLTKALEEQKREALELNQKTIMYGILEKEVESNQKIYNALLERMKETRVTERLENTNIQIVDQAAIPNSPIAPRKARNILLAIVVGLLISITLAFFLEYWRDKIETPEDFKQHLDMPFLGIIPKVSVQHILPHDKKATKDVIVATIVLIDPQSGISEAYRGLRTHIMFSDFDEEALTHESGSILLFTSPEPSEGKSCTVANLGITMAQSGQKTLILDCDFRKPRVDKIFHLKEKTYGFADILMHSDAQNGVVEVIQHTDIQNLDVISCGTIPSNPSELLSLKKTAGIIKKLGKKYEKILIDSPPVNVVTDPIILSQIVNGVVLIFHGEKTRRNVAQHARDQLREAGATILGGVINNVDMKKVRYHHYYYYYAYHYPKYYREKEDV